MRATLKLHHNSSWLDHEKDILPIMTAIFVDGLWSGPKGQIAPTPKRLMGLPGKSAPRIFRLPFDSVDAGSLPEQNRAFHQPRYSASEENRREKRASNRSHAVLRSLILGISHHYNNILMGIWGNASLIRMQLNPDDELYPRVVKMEKLIQSGGFLIHMVLGYLGERRTVAKRIRLNQLISEIKSQAYSNSSDDENDPWNFEARLKWASRVQRPRMIASSTARVLEVLFRGIESKYKEIMTRQQRNEAIHQKLKTIDMLVARGIEISCKLRLYAGDFSKNAKTEIQIESLVVQGLKTFKEAYPTIETHCRISSEIPMLMADRLQLEWAFNEILSNCANAMPGGGTLKINAQTLQEESPEERCGVQKGGNYLVITVKNSGESMPEAIKKRIFEPFFTNPKNSRRLGLGLAAADGIFKSHSGYIHLKSKPESGNTFKLYLPL